MHPTDVNSRERTVEQQRGSEFEREESGVVQKKKKAEAVCVDNSVLGMSVFVVCVVVFVGIVNNTPAQATLQHLKHVHSEQDQCPNAMVNTDQVGGTVLAGIRPNFITADTDTICCHKCTNFTGCTTWIREPTTNHCWLIRGGTPVTKNTRNAGFMQLPPTPPPPNTLPNIFVDAYGQDSVRVRVTYGDQPELNVPGALMPLDHTHKTPTPTPPHKWGSERKNDGVTNGNIKATMHPNGFSVTRVSDGQVLFSTTSLTIASTVHPDYLSWNLTTQSSADERIWGLGERMTGQLDNKGLNIDFKSDQKNTHITIPFAVSNKLYGVFFNSASWGGVDLSNPNSTTWSATMSKQLDFCIMTFPDGSRTQPYSSILSRYYDAIGHPPVLPDWALGFWASKERYASQTEIIDVVKNYSEHNIEVDVLVIDWKHYECVGDWDFTLNPSACWPNPAAMVKTLKGLGVKQVFVSLHPWSEPGSTTYTNMTTNNFCARDANGNIHDWAGWTLPTCQSAPGTNCLYDCSNKNARQFLWDTLKTSYFDKGISNFWTDGTEPAGAPQGGLPDDMVFFSDTTGKAEWPSPSAFLYWPVWHSKTVYEGSIAAGAAANGNGSWSLARSAWAGSHLHNTIVWSGDIGSDWGTLQNQVKAGLNMQLVYPYWNSDTAGFRSGDYTTMGELMVRWFQFSIFTGVVRMHGQRTPKKPSWIPLDEQCDPTGASGGPIEPWVYGPSNISALNGIKMALALRKTMLPYLRTQVKLLASAGQPFMRPLWYDFEQDITAETIEDQFMFGPDYMVAPVLVQGATTREVYFPSVVSPASVSYQDYFTNKSYAPGLTTVDLGPLDTFPLFRITRL